MHKQPSQVLTERIQHTNPQCNLANKFSLPHRTPHLGKIQHLQYNRPGTAIKVTNNGCLIEHNQRILEGIGDPVLQFLNTTKVMSQLHRANVRPARPTIKIPCTGESTTPHTEIFFSHPARPIPTNAHTQQRLPNLVIYFNQSNFFSHSTPQLRKGQHSLYFRSTLENAIKAEIGRK